MAGRAAVVALAVAALGLGAAACGGDSSGSGSASVSSAAPTARTFAPVDAPLNPASAVAVSAVDNVFRPEALKVRAGTVITFTNDGRNDHDVLPAALPDGARGFRVEASRFRPTDRFTVTLDRPGTYRYYCSIHGTARRGMIGAVIVVPAS